MVRAEVSTTINRPVDEVFEFVRDENNLPKWDPDLLDVKTTSEGEFGVGRNFHLDIKPFMGATEGTGEVVGYEANKKVQFQFDLGKVRPLVSHIVEQQGLRQSSLESLKSNPRV